MGTLNNPCIMPGIAAYYSRGVFGYNNPVKDPEPPERARNHCIMSLSRIDIARNDYSSFPVSCWLCILLLHSIKEPRCFDRCVLFPVLRCCVTAHAFGACAYSYFNDIRQTIIDPAAVVPVFCTLLQ